MKNNCYIQIPIREGKHSRQAHCDLPDGTYERELGREGFYGPVSQMHHRHPPTDWISFEGPLKPRAFNMNEANHTAQTPWEISPCLYNKNTKIRYWHLASSMTKLVRNSDGDDLLFIHAGYAEFYCDYGHLSLREGDYIVVPRGTMWRLETITGVTLLIIENTDSCYRLPDKGLVGYNALYDPAVLDHPHINEQFLEQQDESQWDIQVKRLNTISTITYPFNPLDAIGWHGTNTVIRLNWRDIRPLSCHNYHIPPSAHTTFVGNDFVVCTFCPRPTESDPQVLNVPFFHNNDDYDEVLFYHQGDFFSRDHIKAGMLTLHPCGFSHGPHPKALEKSKKNPVSFLNEVAVMIDTRYPLYVSDTVLTNELTDYVNSWKS